MAQGLEETNVASKRRWLYGFNMVLVAVAAVVLLAFFLALTNKYRKPFDMTTGGIYSLSGSTQKLLAQIDEKKQPYHILSFFQAGPSDAAAQRAQRVTDELDEYARRSSYIKVEEAQGQSQDEIQSRIKALYTEELKPYEATIGEFDSLAQELESFLKAQGANIGAMAQKAGTPPAAVQEAAQLQGFFAMREPEDVEAARRNVRKAMEAPLPQWSTVAGSLKQAMDALSTNLGGYADQAKMRAGFDPAVAAYFVKAAPEFKAQLEKLKAYRAKLDKLPELKVEGVLNAMADDTVLILGPTSAKVIGQDALFTQGPAPAGSQVPSQIFTGEQGISSALMAMMQPEKVKVVFVSPSAQQLTTGMYSLAAGVLKDSNFDVLEWSPPGPPQGPNQPPQDPNPPAEGKGVVWIVFPPAPPNQQMMMMGMAPPDPRPVIEAVRKHMAEGGQVMFLADASGGAFMGGGAYPYQELLTDFGVDVQTKYTVVHMAEMQDPDSGDVVKRVIPAMRVDQYLKHEITDPLASLPLIMEPTQGQSGYIGMPTVVATRSPLPQDAQATVLFQTPNTADYWGESDFNANSTFDKTQDYSPPCPMAVAATRFAGVKGKEQRVVVVGSSAIACNDFLEESQPVQDGNQIRLVAPFPGNSEFFRNSVLWLAGYENMIAVSSKASVAMRIGYMSPATLEAIRWGILFGGAPIGALVIGVCVWFMRRR